MRDRRNQAIQLRHLEAWTARRREIAARYIGSLAEIDGVESSGTSFVATVPSGQALDIRIVKQGYEYVESINVTYTTSQTIPVNQLPDGNFDTVD